MKMKVGAQGMGRRGKIRGRGAGIVAAPGARLERLKEETERQVWLEEQSKGVGEVVEGVE